MVDNMVEKTCERDWGIALMTVRNGPYHLMYVCHVVFVFVPLPSFPPFPIKFIWPSGFLVIIVLRMLGRGADP